MCGSSEGTFDEMKTTVRINVDSGGELEISAVVCPSSRVSCRSGEDRGVSVVLCTVGVGAGVVTGGHCRVKVEVRGTAHDVGTSKSTFDVLAAVVRMVVDTVTPGVQVAHIRHINVGSLAEGNIGNVITDPFDGVEECHVRAVDLVGDSTVTLDEFSTV